MHGSRSNALLTAGLATSALLLAVHSLRMAPDPDLVARAWPATALTTVMLIMAPPRHRRALAALAGVLFLTACVVAGRAPFFAFGLALANVVEALLVVRWLTGSELERPQLRTWVDYRRWLLGIAVASCTA
ncbi:MAG: domain S-box protein, partial [Marmoricola sp.]|nr:domain S-box protein [Marmoricola sp.]